MTARKPPGIVGRMVLIARFRVAISDKSDGDINGLRQPRKGTDYVDACCLLHDRSQGRLRRTMELADGRGPPHRQRRAWEETTSFVLLHSPNSASQVLNFLPIYVGLGDKLLVMDLTNRTIAHNGMDYATTLASFFPPQDLGTILGNALARR